MKKILAFILAALMVLTVLSACGGEAKDAEKLNFGMGTYAYYGTATDADGETNGEGELIVSVAAVLVDKDGKIVKCDIDSLDTAIAYTSAGAAVASDEILTKRELGDNYGMAAYGGDNNGDGKVLEWYAQADALEGVIVGKTVDEVKALVAGYYGTEEVQNAGCTIGIPDYVNAVVNAVENAKASDATASDSLKVSAVTVTDAKDATADANGAVELEVSIAAVAANGGKITVCTTDVVAAEIAFDAAGKALTDTTAELLTKREIGDSYGMAAYGTDLNGDGKVLEWYAQADAFEAACVGKTADEAMALVVNGYQAVDEVQTAGCTMGVADIAAAIVKAAK